MQVVAIIEMGKGSTRCIHKAYDSDNFLDLGLLSEKIPYKDGVMPIHYGYIHNVINIDEGDEVDVLVFSKNNTKTGDRIEVTPFALFIREDKDHKVLAYDETLYFASYDDVSPDLRDLLNTYFCYHSPIIKIGNKEEAERYINSCAK